MNSYCLLDNQTGDISVVHNFTQVLEVGSWSKEQKLSCLWVFVTTRWASKATTQASKHWQIPAGELFPANLPNLLVRHVFFLFVCFCEAAELNIKTFLSEQVCVLEYREEISQFAIGLCRGRILMRVADVILLSQVQTISRNTTLLRSDPAATIFSLFILVRLLFEGGVYFVVKPDNKRRLNKVHAGDSARPDKCWYSSTRSLSVLLSAVETSLRTRTLLEITK